MSIMQNMFDSKMHLMDCMEGMKKTKDKHYDLAICDIPYGIDVANMAYLKEMKNRVVQKNGSKLNPFKNKTVYTSKDWDKQTPSQEYFDELVRVSKNQIIFGIDYVNWTGVGSGRIKWDKGVAEGMSFNRFEVAYCSIINDTVELPLLWSGMMQAKSLNEPMVQQGNKKLNEKRIHPCHKPTLLYLKLLKDYGFRGMNLLDTHVGGGRIRIAADMFGCNFEGYEIDEEYFFKQELEYSKYKDVLKLDFNFE